MKKVFISIIVSILAFNQSNAGVYNKLWEIHQQSYPYENKVKAEQEEENEYRLSERESTETAFNVLSVNDTYKAVNDIINSNYMQDFNFLCGSKRQPTKHLLNSISRTKTKVGYARLAKRLAEITNDRAELERRQAITKEFVNNPDMLNSVKKNLASLAKTESVFNLFYNIDKISSLLDFVKSRLWSNPALNALNNSPSGIALRNAYEYFMVLIASKMLFDEIKSVVKQKNYAMDVIKEEIEENIEGNISVYSIMKNLFSTDEYHNLSNAISAVISIASSLPKTVLDMRSCNKTMAIVQKQTHSVFKFLNNTKTILNTVRHNRNIKNLPTVQKAIAMLDQTEESMKKNTVTGESVREELLVTQDNELDVTRYYHGIQTTPFERLLATKFTKYSWLIKSGKVILAFKLMSEIKNDLIPLIEAIAEIDMYCSTAQYFIEHQNTKNKVCFVEYVNSNKPYLTVANCWNVLVGPSAVANSIKLGEATNGEGYNIVLTGPNESGKSTFQKSLIISIIMAQTCGIAHAQAMVLQPFERIKYYQNIADETVDGKSRFRNEAEQFNSLFNPEPNKISYISSDEPTTGANARNCAAIAFHAAKDLVEDSDCICVMSTHYPLLSRLENETNKLFKNYKFSIHRDQNGSIVYPYPYTLEEGISDQNVEFDVLAKAGLKRSTLEKAQAMIKSGDDLNMIRAKL